MPINLFSAVTIKEWLADGSKKAQRWRCYACEYPSCNQCSSRPVHAVPHNAMVQGRYYCESCRYPPCKAIRNGKVCGNRRDNYGGKHRFKEYICPSCRESGNKPAVSLDAGIPAAADPFSMASSSRPVAAPLQLQVLRASLLLLWPANESAQSANTTSSSTNGATTIILLRMLDGASSVAEYVRDPVAK